MATIPISIVFLKLNDSTYTNDILPTVTLTVASTTRATRKKNIWNQ